MDDRKVFVFVLTCFLANITVLSGTLTNFLDIEELKNIHYDIDIREKPVVYGRPLHNEVVYLSSKYGQRYECQIPDVSDVGKVQEEEKSAAETGITELLKPMEHLPCLQKTKDWWTYEFCFGKYVQQFHMENNKKTSETITLGVFESEMNWENKTHSDAKRHRLNRYHSHKYVNGSTCDLTGKPRETEVRFLCAENELDTLSRVDEPESCRYVITVHTMRICHHPYLKPLTVSRPKTIMCFPLLMPDQYEQYIHQQIINKYSREAQELDPIYEDEEEEGEEKADATMKEKPHVPRDGVVDEEEEGNGVELLEEHHLQDSSSDVGTITLITEDGDDIQIETSNMDLGNGQFADALSGVLTRVRDTLKNINDEAADDDKSTNPTEIEDGGEKTDPSFKDPLQGKEKNDRERLEDDPLDDDDDGIDNIDDDDEDEEEDDPEMAEMMKKDYRELVKQMRALSRKDPETADRLLQLSDDIEATFEDLEEMDRFLKEMEVQEIGEDSSTMPDEPSQHASGDPSGAMQQDVDDGMGNMEVGDSEKHHGESRTSGKDDGDDYEYDEDEPPVIQGTEETQEEEGGKGKGTDKKKRKNMEEHLVETLNKLVGQLKEKTSSSSSSSSSGSESGGKVAPSQTDSLNSRVRVRVTRVKLDKENKAKSEQELKFYDTDHRDIEEAISDHLEKSGLNVKGMGGFELRVLSYVPEDWPDQGTEDQGFAVLSEEESNYFRNMIFGLVTRADQEEQEKHERLMKNYGFTWGATSDQDQARGPEELDRSEIQVLIPSVGPKGAGQVQAHDGSSDPEN